MTVRTVSAIQTDLTTLQAAMAAQIEDNIDKLVSPKDIRDNVEQLRVLTRDTLDTLDAIGGKIATPSEFGAIGDGVTDDTTAVLAAINNADGFATYISKTHAVSDMTVSTNGKRIFGNGTLQLLAASNVASTITISGTDNLVEGITVSGNTTGSPAVAFSSIRVSGDRNTLNKVFAKDGHQSTAVRSDRSNFHISGADCTLVDCRSDNAGYASVIPDVGADNLRIDGFTSTNEGGNVPAGNQGVSFTCSLVNGLRVSDFYGTDSFHVAPNNVAAGSKMRDVVLNGVRIEASIAMGDFVSANGMKFNNCDDMECHGIFCYFENTNASAPNSGTTSGLILGEQLGNVTFHGGMIHAAGAHSSSRHYQHAPAAVTPPDNELNYPRNVRFFGTRFGDRNSSDAALMRAVKTGSKRTYFHGCEFGKYTESAVEVSGEVGQPEYVELVEVIDCIGVADSASVTYLVRDVDGFGDTLKRVRINNSQSRNEGAGDARQTNPISRHLSEFHLTGSDPSLWAGVSVVNSTHVLNADGRPLWDIVDSDAGVTEVKERVGDVVVANQLYKYSIDFETDAEATGYAWVTIFTADGNPVWKINPVTGAADLLTAGTISQGQTITRIGVKQYRLDAYFRTLTDTVINIRITPAADVNANYGSGATSVAGVGTLRCYVSEPQLVVGNVFPTITVNGSVNLSNSPTNQIIHQDDTGAVGRTVLINSTPVVVTNDTVTTILTFPTTADKSYHISFQCVAIEGVSFDETDSYSFEATFQNDGGTLTQKGSTGGVYGSSTTTWVGASILLSGSDVSLRFQQTVSGTQTINIRGAMTVLVI